MRKKDFLIKDMILILSASFFYLSSPMLITPLITGFLKTIEGLPRSWVLLAV